MRERIRFVEDYRSGLYEMKELCELYGISRKTGYKWRDRFEAEGGQRPSRSQPPHHCEHRMAASVREALLDARRRHPTWGPRKLRVWLESRRPKLAWPAPSTVVPNHPRVGVVLVAPAPGKRSL